MHKKGLLHREIHVWFYTPKGEIVFQKRASDKDTFPGLLDATVGGHVEIGDSYIKTAIKETQEETGIKLKENDFEFLRMMRRRHVDKVTDKVNDCIGAVYVYKFEGDLKDLQVEEGAATGFETWPVDKILSLTDEEKKKLLYT